MDLNFVRDVENRYFRTQCDIGAHPNALEVWNEVRRAVGLPPLRKRDIPSCFEANDAGWGRPTLCRH